MTELTAGLGDPGWRLFAYSPLSRLEGLPSNAYVVVWAGPDPAGREGVIALRADALGPSGSRRAVRAGLRFLRKPVSFPQFEAAMAELVEHAGAAR